MSNDPRPRFKYILPDGRPLTVIGDHGQKPEPIISFELRSDDTLWGKAQRISGSQRRLVYATLALGL